MCRIVSIVVDSAVAGHHDLSASASALLLSRTPDTLSIVPSSSHQSVHSFPSVFDTRCPPFLHSSVHPLPLFRFPALRIRADAPLSRPETARPTFLPIESYPGPLGTKPSHTFYSPSTQKGIVSFIWSPPRGVPRFSQEDP